MAISVYPGVDGVDVGTVATDTAVHIEKWVTVAFKKSPGKITQGTVCQADPSKYAKAGTWPGTIDKGS